MQRPQSIDSLAPASEVTSEEAKDATKANNLAFFFHQLQRVPGAYQSDMARKIYEDSQRGTF